MTEGTSLYFRTIQSIHIDATIDDNNDLTLAFSINVVRSSREDRYHANSTCFPLFYYFIIGVITSKGSGGYEFNFFNDK